MSEHEKTIEVRASAEETFRYVSSVSNLSEFVPSLEAVREDEENHVFGIMNRGAGRRSEVSGFFRVDESRLRLDWESDGTPEYQGWLRIVPEGSDRAWITVHISMPAAAAEVPPSEPGLAADRIERSLDGSLRAIRDAVENRMAPTRSAV
jgi:uncharacterized membrane protein